MPFEIAKQTSLGGGINTLDEENKLQPNEFRSLLDASLEDGETLQTPPGDTRINATQISVAFQQRIKLLAEYNQSTGARRRYAKVGDSLVEWTLAGVVSAPVVSGLAVGEIPGWTVHQDKFILVESSGNRITNGAVWGPLGSDPPPTPALVQFNGAGALTLLGVYRFRVSRFSTVLNQESGLSVEATITLVGLNDTVNVGPLAPALDAIWDTYRIYRTTAGGSVFFREASFAVSLGTFTSVDSDLILAGKPVAPTQDSVKPLPCAFVVIHLNRVFLAGFFSSPDFSAIRMSEPGQPSNFPTANRITFAAEDGDRITGLWVRGTRLFIAKKTKIFELLGDQPGNFEIVELERGRGVRCQRCTTTIGDREFILDTQTGPFTFSNQEATKIGAKVLPTVRQFNDAQANNFVAEHEPQTRAWWISTFSKPQVTVDPDTILVFHYERNAWLNLRLPGVTAMGLFHDVNERLRLCYGTNLGFIHLVDADGNKMRVNLPGNISGKIIQPTTVFGYTTDFGGIFTLGNGWLGGFTTVVFLDANRKVIRIETRQIAGNFANSVAVLAPFFSAPQTGDLWFLGAFFMDGLTGKTDIGDNERRKHVPFYWMHFTPQDHSTDLFSAFIADDEQAADDTDLANFTQLLRSTQQLPAIRGGGGRRPALAALRIVGICANQPFRVKGYSIAYMKSAYDRPKTSVP